ncbi:metabolite traffic protein EboE [Paraglaciecola aquimarina]|uniref:Metabolite traffic protein EboE n=1 Tax=Paraglaciecola algarum TaxID=3050085 RepID=A0ABS9D1Z5_9ALTE|nr:metabolite traffic protein EboE [Paraglaciecola sp. G1-23]MCF2946925.1 metabolite traffic protein EboE [Paraglaciecola sp. G1-23]
MAYSINSLAYCSNVHPGADLSSVISNIQQHFVSVKNLRNLNDMASGLWFSEQAAKQLRNQASLNDFKRILQESGVRLTSLNGFPFGDFHQAVVKQKVYLPTWAESERLEYTQSLASILAECLPIDECKGAISTLPLGYAKGWNTAQQQQSVAQLLSLVTFLADQEAQTGKQIVICIEMEPDCVLQHTHELVSFFTEHLLPTANQQGIDSEKVLRYLGCCYDTCHQAVMGESIVDSLQAITLAGIQIGKIQISNAVKATIQTRSQIEQLTKLFADNKFLHQTKVFSHNKLIDELPDLDMASLEKVRLNCSDSQANNNELGIEATIHYHIPVNQSAADLPLDFLSATQSAILQTLDFLQVNPRIRPFLEIETYTWLNFLQQDNAQQQTKTQRLHSGFAAEFSWLEQALIERNLLKV